MILRVCTLFYEAEPSAAPGGGRKRTGPAAGNIRRRGLFFAILPFHGFRRLMAHSTPWMEARLILGSIPTPNTALPSGFFSSI